MTYIVIWCPMRYILVEYLKVFKAPLSQLVLVSSVCVQVPQTTYAADIVKTEQQQAQAQARNRGNVTSTQRPQLMPLTAKTDTYKLQGKAEVIGSEADERAPLAGRVNRNRTSLRRMTPYLGYDTSIPLKGKVDTLSDGTKLFSLRDEKLFGAESAHLIPGAATVDMNKGFVHDTVFKAFAKMDCLETAELGANYYTAPAFYKPLQYGGRSIAIGATSKGEAPVLKMTVQGHVENINMHLPGLHTQSHNVMVLTDNLHVLSIDPRTHDSWQLQLRGQPGAKSATWQKMIHPKSQFASIIKSAM